MPETADFSIERQVYMQHVYALQRQPRKRGPLATTAFAFTEPTRLFAPATFPSSPLLPSERQGHLAHVAQFKHSFDHISIRPPDSSGGAGYRVDMQQTGTQPFSLQRKESRRRSISPEGAPLQRVEQSSPASSDTVYTIRPGDTLGTIAAAHNTTWQSLAQHNQIANPNLIYPGQQLNIPGSRTNDAAPQLVDAPQPTNTPLLVDAPQPQPTSKIPEHNTANLFPAGQCTWWANERYQQLTGYYVPWTTNSNANQWTARANDFGWHVSDQPGVGAIIDFQAGVQLASDVGHVAIVEKIMPNGDLITSNMNVWGHPFGSVVNLTNHPGPGVTFITYQ
jgi:surface antigen